MIVPCMLMLCLYENRESTCAGSTPLLNCLNMLVEIGFIKFKILKMKNRAVLQFIAGRNKSMKKSKTYGIANHTFENEHLQSSMWHLILSDKREIENGQKQFLPVPLIKKKIDAWVITEKRAITDTTRAKPTFKHGYSQVQAHSRRRQAKRHNRRQTDKHTPTEAPFSQHAGIHPRQTEDGVTAMGGADPGL